MKYPKTYHLPWSEGVTDNDKVIKDISHLIDKTVVITEKLDGENTSLFYDKTHARSIDSSHHSSRSFVKRKWAEIAHKIPKHLQLVVENMYAEHSVFYDRLTDYIYGICIIENDKVVMGWEETIKLFRQLHILPVPTLFYGTLDRHTIEKLKKTKYSSDFGEEMEGYVIRIADSFNVEDYKYNVLKYVRKNHVQTDIHWTKTWKPNELISRR